MALLSKKTDMHKMQFSKGRHNFMSTRNYDELREEAPDLFGAHHLEDLKHHDHVDHSHDKKEYVSHLTGNFFGEDMKVRKELATQALMKKIKERIPNKRDLFEVSAKLIHDNHSVSSLISDHQFHNDLELEGGDRNKMSGINFNKSQGSEIFKPGHELGHDMEDEYDPDNTRVSIEYDPDDPKNNQDNIENRRLRKTQLIKNAFDDDDSDEEEVLPYRSFMLDNNTVHEPLGSTRNFAEVGRFGASDGRLASSLREDGNKLATHSEFNNPNNNPNNFLVVSKPNLSFHISKVEQKREMSISEKSLKEKTGYQTDHYAFTPNEEFVHPSKNFVTIKKPTSFIQHVDARLSLVTLGERPVYEPPDPKPWQPLRSEDLFPKGSITSLNKKSAKPKGFILDKNSLSVAEYKMKWEKNAGEEEKAKELSLQAQRDAMRKKVVPPQLDLRFAGGNAPEPGRTETTFVVASPREPHRASKPSASLNDQPDQGNLPFFVPPDLKIGDPVPSATSSETPAAIVTGGFLSQSFHRAKSLLTLPTLGLKSTNKSKSVFPSWSKSKSGEDITDMKLIADVSPNKSPAAKQVSISPLAKGGNLQKVYVEDPHRSLPAPSSSVSVSSNSVSKSGSINDVAAFKNKGHSERHLKTKASNETGMSAPVIYAPISSRSTYSETTVVTNLSNVTDIMNFVGEKRHTNQLKSGSNTPVHMNIKSEYKNLSKSTSNVFAASGLGTNWLEDATTDIAPVNASSMYLLNIPTEYESPYSKKQRESAARSKLFSKIHNRYKGDKEGEHQAEVKRANFNEFMEKEESDIADTYSIW
jgi:hypothetical protein